MNHPPTELVGFQGLLRQTVRRPNMNNPPTALVGLQRQSVIGFFSSLPGLSPFSCSSLGFHYNLSRHHASSE
jgi:hypothetical protein